MPLIRVETRPSVLATTGQIFGPWPHDILVRGLLWTYTITVAAQGRLGRVGNTLYGQAGPNAMEVYPSGPKVVLGTGAAVVPTVRCSAVPGAGSSSTTEWDAVLNGETASTAPVWQFSIPYNWIVPASGVLYVHLDNAAAGDLVGVTNLWYEIGMVRPAMTKQGGRGAPSSKNNP